MPSVLLSCFLVNNNDNNKNNNNINNNNIINNNNNNNNNNKYQSGASRTQHHRPPALSLILWSLLPPAPLATPSCFPFGPQEARLFPILNITSQRSY
jgi:hypothetical protein